MRLIDADELLEKVQCRLHFDDVISKTIDKCVEITRRLINDAPTIEAEPVRHGRWEEYQVPHIVCCSECDWGTGVQDKYNYCPNCGAKMDGGGDGATN